nr:hypothetical protein [Vibrio cholerae]
MAANFTAFGVGRVFVRCICVKWSSNKCVKKVIVKQWATKLTNASRGTVNA